MNYDPATSCAAFSGPRRIAAGDLITVARKVKQVIGHNTQTPVLIFDDATSRPIEIDFRGTVNDVLRRLTPPPRRPGRPRLGVVPREVTLLPRHWEWLNGQPGGASVALRRLVDEARRTHAERDAGRGAQDAAYRFMLALAGNEPGYEEAVRALYAQDRARFDELTSPWPKDVREHARKLAAPAFND
jgi:hypothetical protein